MVLQLFWMVLAGSLILVESNCILHSHHQGLRKIPVPTSCPDCSLNQLPQPAEGSLSPQENSYILFSAFVEPLNSTVLQTWLQVQLTTSLMLL